MSFSTFMLRVNRVSRCSCVAGIIICGIGCENPVAEPVQQPSSDIKSQSTDISDSNKEDEPSAASRVEPGTELTEADFVETLQETGAKLVVVQVYLEGCGPCMTEALRLTEKEEEWRSAGVAILGMGMDETSDGPKRFYEHTGKRITYPLYLAPWFSEQQEVIMTPTVFIYSVDGKQLFRTDPEHAEEGIMATLDAELSRLLGESSG